MDAARARGQGHLLLQFQWKALEALDVGEAERAHPEILETYGIPNDRNL